LRSAAALKTKLPRFGASLAATPLALKVEIEENFLFYNFCINSYRKNDDHRKQVFFSLLTGKPAETP